MIMQDMRPNPVNGQLEPIIKGGWPPTNDEQWCRAWEPDE
jgi:hypothetical protein